MKKTFAAAMLALPGLFLLPTAGARAVDSVSAEWGHGTRGVDMWRFGAQWKQDLHWLPSERWSFYWDASLGNWDSDIGTLVDAGLTPTFRYGDARRWYLDGGIGFHYLSDQRVSGLLDFSTRFQFGDHIGAGYRFKHNDVSIRLQHLSNGGIRNPNPGINFLQLRVQYWF